MILKDIKSQFPIFKSNKNLIYFDTANSAQKPKQVIDALEDFYKNHYCLLLGLSLHLHLHRQ